MAFDGLEAPPDEVLSWIVYLMYVVCISAGALICQLALFGTSGGYMRSKTTVV